MQAKNFKMVKAIKPTDKLTEFIGKTLIITIDQPEGGTPVVVETIQGSIVKEYVARFEVNNAYHIVILDAYKQLNKDKSITQEMIDDFDQCVVESIEKVDKPDAITATKQAPSFNQDGDHEPATN